MIDSPEQGPNGEEDERGAGVLIPPPLFPIGAILLGVLLERLWPLTIPDGPAAYWLGRVLAVAGLALIVLVGLRFRRAETDIRPHKPTSALVQDGIFRLSRNPIYLCLLLLQIAVAFILNTYWIVITIPLSWAGLNFYVIRREEAYLAQKFGQDYEDYRARVRRWL